MYDKIEVLKEVLSKAQNSLIFWLIVFGLGRGLIASKYLKI